MELFSCQVVVWSKLFLLSFLLFCVSVICSVH